uniref:Uncharacterized protein MANES_01G151200 n=1 Tax=Rhizophora mucronata TaxID=61149 RepID=A0A2P2L5C9_RHIMU
MYRPSRTDWFRYLTQRFASSTLSIVMNAKPREMRVRGSITRKQEATFPSLEKCSSRSLSVTLVDSPVT